MTEKKDGGGKLRNVAILRPGSYRDMQGRPVRFSGTELEAIAASYDPQYHLATVNLDHSDSGPALGRITALHWDGAFLRAQIEGLPDWLATELSEGRWPARSAEIWRELDGRGPYLRGLAFLGARAPAVRGLPALPEPVLAADSGLALVSVFMEGEMDPGNDSAAVEMHRLGEENRRLSAELATLRRREAEADVDGLLDELRSEGRITPGMERSGLRELLLGLSAGDTETLLLADGSELDAAQCLEGLLRSLPATELGAELAAADGMEMLLSAHEQEVAGSLGLTDSEYAQIRDGRTA